MDLHIQLDLHVSNNSWHMLIRNTHLALLFVSLRMCHFSIVFESACCAICLWLILGAVWSVLALSAFSVSALAELFPFPPVFTAPSLTRCPCFPWLSHALGRPCSPVMLGCPPGCYYSSLISLLNDEAAFSLYAPPQRGPGTLRDGFVQLGLPKPHTGTCHPPPWCFCDLSRAPRGLSPLDTGAAHHGKDLSLV